MAGVQPLYHHIKNQGLICYGIRCVIVDSTRKGKPMPDALSKTIPIWCCVINRLLFKEHTEAHILHTPEGVVSESEHAHIEDRMCGFVDVARVLGAISTQESTADCIRTSILMSLPSVVPSRSRFSPHFSLGTVFGHSTKHVSLTNTTL